MRVVEVGQYSVTRDAGEFQQTVVCREGRSRLWPIQLWPIGF